MNIYLLRSSYLFLLIGNKMTGVQYCIAWDLSVDSLQYDEESFNIGKNEKVNP